VAVASPAMAGCCDPSGYRRVFSSAQAAKAVRAFERKGLDGTAGPMIAALEARSISGSTLLEVGAGPATALVTLLEAGVARRLELDGHVYAYVACLPEHHHHLSCTSCGRVEEIAEEYVRPIATRVAREMGFEIDDARLDFYGRCSTCGTSAATPPTA